MSGAEICEKFLEAASRLTDLDKAGELLGSLRSLAEAPSLEKFGSAIAVVAAGPLVSKEGQ